MRSRIVAAIAALSIALTGAAWSGCGGGDDEADDQIDQVQEQVDEATEDAPDEAQEGIDEAQDKIDQAQDDY
jgi:hypothetical protein